MGNAVVTVSFGVAFTGIVPSQTCEPVSCRTSCTRQGRMRFCSNSSGDSRAMMRSETRSTLIRTVSTLTVVIGTPTLVSRGRIRPEPLNATIAGRSPRPTLTVSALVSVLPSAAGRPARSSTREPSIVSRRNANSGAGAGCEGVWAAGAGAGALGAGVGARAGVAGAAGCCAGVGAEAVCVPLSRGELGPRVK